MKRFNKMTKADIHLVVNVNHRLHRSFIPDFLWFYISTIPTPGQRGSVLLIGLLGF